LSTVKRKFLSLTRFVHPTDEAEKHAAFYQRGRPDHPSGPGILRLSCMTSKERLMLAICREKPDRLPVSIHQWQPYHLEKHMGGRSNLEAFRMVGLDAKIQHFEVMDLITSIWRDVAVVINDEPNKRTTHHTIQTPEGILTYKTEGDRKTTWITEHLIKRDEDIDLIKKYMPVINLKLEPIAKKYNELGDNGILRGFVGGNQESWEFKQKVGNRMALIGDLDQFNVLTSGSEITIRDKVFELFDKVGKNGGYICSASDHFFETPADNLVALAEAAKTCLYE